VLLENRIGLPVKVRVAIIEGQYDHATASTLALQIIARLT
jgi:hypothetical protein